MDAAQTAALEALNKLNADQLRGLIPTFNQMIKQKRTMAAHAITTTNVFAVGDVLGWESTKRKIAGQNYLKFEKYNRVGSHVVGQYCSKDGTLIGGQWTVPVTMLNSKNGSKI